MAYPSKSRMQPTVDLCLTTTPAYPIPKTENSRVREMGECLYRGLRFGIVHKCICKGSLRLKLDEKLTSSRMQIEID